MKVLAALALLCLGLPLCAQHPNLIVTQTSTSYGIALSDKQISFTGLMPDIPSNAQPLVVLVDQEAMLIVESISPGALDTGTVKRAYLGTTAAKHFSGSLAYIGIPSQFGTSDKSGACQLPPNSPQFINVVSQLLWTCISGVWTSSPTAVIGNIPAPLPIVDGGTGTTSPTGVTAGNGLSVTGVFPNQTTSLITPVSIVNGGTGTATPGLNAGVGIIVTGSWPGQTISAAQNFVVATNYIFTPQIPGGTLTAATPATVTIAPVPLGVNASNGKYYMCLTGGTGTSESVLVTGGTAVSGNSSGTVIFTPANNHSGAWTIGSCGFGAPEAEYALLAASPAGGTVIIPNGTFTPQAPIPYLDNIAWVGEGIGTKILPATCSSVIFDANVPVKSSSDVTIIQDNVAFKDFLIEGAQCAGVNSLVGIQELNQTASTEQWSLIGAQFENLWFDNVGTSIQLDRVAKAKLLNLKTYENSSILITDSIIKSTYFNSEITVDKWQYTWHPINANSVQVSQTGPLLLFNNCETCFLENSQMAGRPIMNMAAVQIAGGEDNHIINNTLETFFYSIALTPINFTDLGGQIFYPGHVEITHNNADQIWGSFLNVVNGTDNGVNHQSSTLLIADNTLTNPNTTFVNPILLNLGDYTSDVALNGNKFGGLTSNSEFGLRIGDHSDNIKLGSTNLFTNRQIGSPFGTGIIVGTATNVFGLQNQNCINFTTCISDGGFPVASIAAADPLVLPTGRTQVDITAGVGTINSITAQPAGTTVNLQIYVALTVKNGTGNVHLGTDFTANGINANSLVLVSDGANWYKVSSSVN